MATEAPAISSVKSAVKTGRSVVSVAVSVAVVVITVVAAIGLFGGARVIPGSQATSLSLFSGKAATQADKTIISQITTCGKESGTILNIQWSGPPLRVSSVVTGENASLSAPGKTGPSEVSCLAALYLAKGATAQSCPGIAVGSGGAATADARSFVAQFVSCESAVQS